MTQTDHKESAAKTWLSIVFCVLIVLAQGLYAFYVIGDLGQPTWAYRPAKDVPGQSPYAIYELLPHPQHVRGARGE